MESFPQQPNKFEKAKKLTRKFLPIILGALSIQQAGEKVEMKDFNSKIVSSASIENIKRPEIKNTHKIKDFESEISPIFRSIQTFEDNYEKGIERRLELDPNGIAIIPGSYIGISDDIPGQNSLNDRYISEDLEVNFIKNKDKANLFSRDNASFQAINKESRLEDASLIDPQYIETRETMGKPTYYFVVERFRDSDGEINYNLQFLSPSKGMDETLYSIKLERDDFIVTGKENPNSHEKIIESMNGIIRGRIDELGLSKK